MPRKKYLINLSDGEQQELLEITRKGEVKARKMKRAMILLKADEGLSDPQIMAAISVSRPTVERIRKRFVEGGLERALNEDPRPGQKRKLTVLYGSKGICVTAVTKGVCGSPRIASALLDSGIRSFGESRIANIQKMREAGLDAQFILKRSPMPSEVERVVEFADMSLNTEISIIRFLARQAPIPGQKRGAV